MASCLFSCDQKDYESRRIDVRLLGDPYKSGARPLLCTMYFCESDEIPFEGILRAMRLWGVKLPRNLGPNKDNAGVVAETKEWSQLVSSGESWDLVIERLRAQSGDLSITVYYSRASGSSQ